MNAEQYRAVIGWFNARPVAKMALRVVSRGAVALVYLGYLGMLAWLVWHRMGQFWPALVVPAAAFLVGTLVRKAIDRPRPYTALGFTPLFPKDKAGQSMPSRHCFSAAAIAGVAWYVFQPWGWHWPCWRGHCGLPRRDRGTLCQRRAGGPGLRHSVFRTGLERLCTCGVCPGVLRHYAFVKGT